MPSGSQSGTRILVIEDTQEFVDLAVAALTPAGFALEVARDGQTGVEMARSFRPAVVVLHITLPVLDGIEVCRQLRTVSEAYVLMLTARDSEIDRVIGLSVGVDDYRVKPFFPSELVARIKAMLRRVRGAGVAPAQTERVFGALRIDPLAPGLAGRTDDHVIDVHLSNLRRKLGDDPRHARFVRTARRFGFRMGDGTAS
jgi:DNA-binding response OmpR family regulator